MQKIIAVLLGAALVLLAGCGEEAELPEGYISEYLPITLSDSFRLTNRWHEPPEKTQFSNTELLAVYNAISSLEPYEDLFDTRNEGASEPIMSPFPEFLVGGLSTSLHI